MNARDVAMILRDGTDATKFKVLHDVFFAKPSLVDPTTVPSSELFGLLRSKNSRLRGMAITYLGNRQWDDERFFSEFARLAKDESEDTAIRRNAIYFICLRYTDCLELLDELLMHRNPKIREGVSSNLHRLQSDTANVDRLRSLYVKALGDLDAAVRYHGWSALCEAGNTNKAILKLPKGAAPVVRAYFYGARVAVNPHDKQSVGSLCELLSDRNMSVREAVADGLLDARVFDVSHVKLINTALLDRSPKVRSSMCVVAAYLPPEGLPWLSNLSGCLEDENPKVREDALTAVGSLKDKRQLTLVLRALNAKSEPASLRYRALDALVLIGDNSPEVLAGIRDGARTGCIDRDEAERAIRKLRRR